MTLEYRPDRRRMIQRAVERTTRIEEIPNHLETKIHLSLPIYHKMLCYARASKGEISGFGKTRVRTIKGKYGILERAVHITEVRIFNQVVTGGHTELDADALTQFYLELVKKKENPANWNFWWHSHNDFSTFFSGTDQDTILKLSQKATIYSLCINKDGEVSVRHDRFGIELTGCNFTIEQKIDGWLKRRCEREVRQKVRYKNFVVNKEDYVEGTVHSSGRNHPPYQYLE